MVDFTRIDRRFVLEAQFVTQTALAIGSRVSLFPSGSDLPVMKTPDGLPFIPGSSLKGVIRSYVERILRTLAGMGKSIGGERLWACDPLDKEQSCVPPREKERLAEAAKKKLAEKAEKCHSSFDECFTKLVFAESCTACRLFGHQWMASRVAFQDAYLVNAEALPVLFEVRDGVGIDRDLGAAKRGLKYDFETVPRGAAFGFKVVAENCEDWEMGLLCLAFDALKRGELAIGGKSTRGLGWGTLSEMTIRVFSPEDILFAREGKRFNPEDLIRVFSEALG